MGRPGRPRTAELAALREQIADMYLAGSGPVAIRTALAGSDPPVELSIGQIYAHLKAIREGWVRDTEPEYLSARRAELIAQARATARWSSRLARRHAGKALGVGYANTSLHAQEREAKLLGVDAAVKLEHSGPRGAPIEVEQLDASETARRLALLAEDYAARATEEG